MDSGVSCGRISREKIVKQHESVLLPTEDGELIGSLDEPQSAPMGNSRDFTFEQVTMEGCDIYIPLN